MEKTSSSTEHPDLVVCVPTALLSDAIGQFPGRVTRLVWDLSGPPPTEHIDLLVLPVRQLARVEEALSVVRPRYIQAQSIGVDHLVPVIPRGSILANASSVHENATAELAVALLLAAQRSLPEFVLRQAQRLWLPAPSRGVDGLRITLLGYGGVGREVRRLLSGFDLSIRAVARRPRREDDVRVDGPEALEHVLAETDALLVCLPGGPETHRLVSADALAALPEGALVINVGRGSVIDMDALVSHVRRGRLRAALDVHDPEPLPPDHPLWQMPGAVITPHVGGATTSMSDRMGRLVRQQILRMLDGKAPINVVHS